MGEGKSRTRSGIFRVKRDRDLDFIASKQDGGGLLSSDHLHTGIG